MKPFQIGNHTVGVGHKPFIIAELSGNHNQSLDRALAIVDAAADAGAMALKLQTYTPDTMTLDVDTEQFRVKGADSLWKNRNLYDLYKEAQTPWEWHKPIFERCKERGMIGFSTPFDETAVDFLESLQVPLYKIASFELTDLPLIKCVARTGKPIVMSTGMATVEEIHEAVTAARSGGNDKIVLLKCTSTYPADPSNTNISTIPDMREKFKTLVGLSDHTMGIGVSVASVALGAVMIEKHFTLKRADGGVDSSFSMEPEELKSLVLETKRAFLSLGSVKYGPSEQEKPSLQFRRSIYVAKDVKAGEMFSTTSVRVVRPGFGLAPKFYDEVLGKAARIDLIKGTALTWDHIKK